MFKFTELLHIGKTLLKKKSPYKIRSCSAELTASLLSSHEKESKNENQFA